MRQQLETNKTPKATVIACIIIYSLKEVKLELVDP